MFELEPYVLMKGMIKLLSRADCAALLVKKLAMGKSELQVYYGIEHRIY